jgi:hypothetical protein
MKQRSRFKPQQDSQEELHASVKNEQQTAREFATVEEMLRHDAVHTPVPPIIAHRVQKSLEQNPPAQSWWRRLFGA